MAKGIGRTRHLMELAEAVKNGEPEIYVNLINWTAKAGPMAIKMLEEAGYVPDNLGPQRVYTK